jgi:hypothetical protein
MQRHKQMSQKAQTETVKLLWVGDSIVEKWEGYGKQVWQYYYGDRYALNLGENSDCTQNVIWRLEHGNMGDNNHEFKPKLAIVMIGQNNGPYYTSEEIAAGVIKIVEYLRDKHPHMYILLNAIFQRGAHPTPERKVLKGANDILYKWSKNVANVHYMDVNGIKNKIRYMFLNSPTMSNQKIILIQTS